MEVVPIEVGHQDHDPLKEEQVKKVSPFRRRFPETAGGVVKYSAAEDLDAEAEG
jgi:hypothetical protein